MWGTKKVLELLGRDDDVDQLFACENYGPAIAFLESFGQARAIVTETSELKGHEEYGIHKDLSGISLFAEGSPCREYSTERPGRFKELEDVVDVTSDHVRPFLETMEWLAALELRGPQVLSIALHLCKVKFCFVSTVRLHIGFIGM